MLERPAQTCTRRFSGKPLPPQIGMDVIADFEQKLAVDWLQSQSGVAGEATGREELQRPQAKAMFLIVALAPLDPGDELLRLRVVRVEPPGIRIREDLGQRGYIGRCVFTEPQASALW